MVFLLMDQGVRRGFDKEAAICFVGVCFCGAEELFEAIMGENSGP